jgi:regulatory protein
VATTVVTDLEALGYLDVRAFAAAWAEGRARGRALGPWRLRAELLQRGVDRSIVEEAVGRVSAEMAPEGLARTAAARRAGGLARLTPERAARRLADFLTRRGFSREVVRRVVGETTGAAFSDS